MYSGNMINLFLSIVCLGINIMAYAVIWKKDRLEKKENVKFRVYKFVQQYLLFFAMFRTSHLLL